MADSVDLIETCGGISKHTIYQETTGHALGCAKGLCKQALRREVVLPFLADKDSNSEDATQNFAAQLANIKERFGQPSDKLPALPEDEIDKLVSEVLEEQQDDDLQAERASKNANRRAMGRKQADDVTLYINGNFAVGDWSMVLTFNDEALSQVEDEKHADQILTRFLTFNVDRKLKKYGFRTKWLFVAEYGRLHYHLVVAAEPLPEAKMPKKRDKIVTDIKTQRTILRRIISAEWECLYGNVYISPIFKLSRYKNTLAVYMSKGFGDDKPAYAHRYHKSNNLMPIKRETNDSDPRQMSRYVAAYKSGGTIELRERIEDELPDGRCLLEDPEVCLVDGYAPFIRYFEINGCPAFEDETCGAGMLAPLGVDRHIRLGDPRKESAYIDSNTWTTEYERTRGRRWDADDFATKEHAKSYLSANPINPALKNRYCGYGYGTYLLEDWETPNTVDIDDIPRRRQLCKTLHDLDLNQKALNYARNKSGWAKCSTVVVAEKDIVEADKHEPVFRFIEQWTVDRTLKDHGLETSQDQIYGIYKRDCEQKGNPIRSKSEFDALLRECGIESVALKYDRVGYTIDVTRAAREHFGGCSWR